VNRSGPRKWPKAKDAPRTTLAGPEEQDRERAIPPPPLPVLSQTPEQVQVESIAGMLIRTVEEQAQLKARSHEDDDAQGLPCACGTSRHEICLLHWAIDGHRRHRRPA
jgi:hypothetical protein